MSEIKISEPIVQDGFKGEVEIEIRDRFGRVLSRQREPNIIKIFAKEIFAHCIAHTKVWDPNAGTGSGAWVEHDIDLAEFSAKYIVLGASFDDDGSPLDATDERFYTQDTVTKSYVRKTLTPGATNDGGLINAIPISEPTRPLKRIERVYFESSYQPAGSPLIEDDVRAVNNVVVFETTIRSDEYNGFDSTTSNFFTLTEVALVGAAELSGSLGACECDPRDVFLTGRTDGSPQLAVASGQATITLDLAETDVDHIREGDQVKIVSPDTTAAADSILDQLNPYYLVTSKSLGGHDITLDRIPTDSDDNPLTGEIALFRDGFRIFSHRILSAPVRKNAETEIVLRWRIILN